MGSKSKDSYKLTTELFGDKLEISSAEMGDIFKARASIAAIPKMCPFCGAGFVPDFFVGTRTEDGQEKKFDVYKIICTGADQHELMLSRSKDSGIIFDNKKRDWKQPAKDGSGLVNVKQRKLSPTQLAALEEKTPAPTSKPVVAPAVVNQQKTGAPAVDQQVVTPAEMADKIPENWPKDLGQLRRYLADVCGLESTKHAHVALTSTGKALKDLKPNDYVLVINKASEQPNIFKEQALSSSPTVGAMGKIENESTYRFEDLDKN